MELTVLGSAGWMPASGRETSCYVLRSGRSLLILDAGTGVRRLVDRHAGLLDGVDEINVLLSHFHSDHIIGLTYLSAVTSNVTIWGPGIFYRESTRTILDEATRPPYQPAAISSAYAVNDMDIEGISLPGFDVEFRAQRLHTAPSVAMRINGRIVYCTDTEADEGNIEFARHCELFLHEAWPQPGGHREGHSTPAQAALIAAEAGARELILVHIPPGADLAQMESETANSFSSAHAARDHMRVDVPG